jgi:hypothetical protein
MARTRLGNATFVERGYGQVEPNHLSAQRTGQVYAQLPADPEIELLENGQFVKYDYAKGVVDFDTTDKSGEWMLVFNEVKVYRDGQSDCDFAMIKDNYVARIYSPIDGEKLDKQLTQPRDYSKVVTPADPWEMDSTDNPFQALFDYNGPKKMPENTKMVPRVLKTNVGDIYTTNCLMADLANPPAVGDTFTPGSDGYLAAGEGEGPLNPTFQVVKVYDLGDRQKAVKLLRIS